jgi:hypothetical protein
MPRQNVQILGFNSGALSVEALSRIDLERVPFSLEEMMNFLPRVIGSKTMRPGTIYRGSTFGDQTARLIPFVKNAEATALIELTDGLMRVWVDGALVVRAPVTTIIPNGDFASLTGWTNKDDSGAISDLSGGMLRLKGTGLASARRVRQINVDSGVIGVEHALRVAVDRGPVLFKVGSTSEGQEYIPETMLRTGQHSLTLKPAGDFHITISSQDPVYRYVDSITVEPSGMFAMATPWEDDHIGFIRYDQSGDVIFCACDGVRQMRIERRSMTAWSLCDYHVDDGPFRGLNLTRLSLAPNAVSGNVSITASSAFFDSGHDGALFQLTHAGQTATATLGGADEFTDTIRVTGTNSAGTRGFIVQITGTWTGTITLQRSFGEPGSWSDEATWTGNTEEARTSNFDNEIVYYRLGFKTGDYGTGSAVATLIYNNSSQTGVVRVTDVVSSTQVNAEVIKTLGKAEATFDWREGQWSGFRGYPSSVALHDGRLCWGGRERVYLSVSDAFESFDQGLDGDAGPIIRTIGAGSSDAIYWLKSLGRLFAGGPTVENQVRSSSFDEPLTPTAFTVKRVSSRGSSGADPADVDSSIVFVQRDGRRVYEISYDVESQDYSSKPLTRLNPGICKAGVARVAVQRQPDTRLWFVLEDGTISILTYEKFERVVGWSTFETDGKVEDICVLPGGDEDDVFLVVNRTINGSTKRYVEQLAKESQCVGGQTNMIMDCAKIYSGTATATIAALSHLEAKQTVVWGNGAALADQSALKTVSSGAITLPAATTHAIVGLPYKARSKSMKLAFAAGLGTPLNQLKRVDHLGFLLKDTAWAGIKFGRSYDKLYNIPRMQGGQAIPATTHWGYFDGEMAGFDGKFGTDERVYCEVKAPYPATVVGYTIAMVTNDRG